MRALPLLIAAMLLAACGVGPTPSPPAGPTSPPAGPTNPPVATPTFNAPVGTIDPSTDAVVQSVIADAARVMDRRAQDFELVRADRGTWPDSSLGCPFPNEAYNDALTDGYWVVLSVAGIQVDYRVTLDGGMTICTIPAMDRQGPIS